MIKNIKVSGEVNMIPTLRKIRGGQSKQIWGGQSRDIVRGDPVLRRFRGGPVEGFMGGPV